MQVLRWVVLLGGVLVGLAVLYRWAPDRDNARWRWVSPGAVFAAVAWLVASVLFSTYVSNFGTYNETYGSLGAVVVVMLWLYITALVIVLGAELNCELERQTVKDTTEGRPRPLARPRRLCRRHRRLVSERVFERANNSARSLAHWCPGTSDNGVMSDDDRVHQ